MKLPYRKHVRLGLVIGFLATSLIASQIGTDQDHVASVLCLTALAVEVTAIGLIS